MEDSVEQGCVQLRTNTYTAPEGQVFISWNTEADGTGESYCEGQVVSQNLILYAQWTSLETLLNKTPVITMEAITSGGYSTIRSSGITTVTSTVTISYPNDNVFKNLYSEDNGDTWNEYIAPFTTNAPVIIAKRVLRTDESISTKTEKANVTNSALANDAIGIKAYDYDTNTYYKQNIASNWTNVYINVDNSVRGKKLNYKTTSLSESYAYGYIISYDTSGKATNLTGWIRTKNDSVTIPSNCAKIAFCLQANEVINELWISN